MSCVKCETQLRVSEFAKWSEAQTDLENLQNFFNVASEFGGSDEKDVSNEEHGSEQPSSCNATGGAC
eukprot:4370614-Lingulodinium_polyedra.AAC.1